MRTIGIRVAAVILCLVLSCWGYAGQIVVDAPQDVGMSAEKLGRVSTTVQGLVDEEKIAGASVLVARKGKVVFFETFGMMDKEAGKPVDEDTIFRFYSMTKPVTSVAVMMLVEQGKIGLDDPVSKYIEPFKGLKVYDESGAHAEPAREMTVRDLLRHTSGLTYGFFGNTAVDKTYRENGILDRETSLDDMVEKLGAIPLLYQPGTRWHYGVSTDVLGYLVEKVSGESLDVFFERRIFAPLRMEDTAFYVPQDRADRFAVCYGPRLGKGLRVSDNPRKSEFLEKPGLLSGGGGLVSTAGDYLRFCSMLLNKGELDGKRLLRAETVEMMTRNQLPESVSWNGQGFGLGFSVQVTEGKYGAGEYGWGGAASTHFWIHPKQELIVIALSQLMPYSNQLADAIKPLVYESITSTGLKGAYARNGRIHVGVFGESDGEPITTGPADMKPSWSKTGDMLVFFRVTKFAQEIPNWKTAICVVNVDGTGFHKLTDGTHTDFNPTWTRDGSNRAIFNRRNPNTGGYTVMQSETGSSPGDEVTYLYPRWTKDESAVVYHCDKTGKNQLYMVRLKDGSTVRVSTDAESDYLFPHGEDSPK